MCAVSFIWDCWGFFCTYLLFTRGYFFFLVTHTHLPIPTHSLCKGFALTRIASHWNVGGWWVVLVGRRSEIPPTKVTSFWWPTGKSNNMLASILFITQSGSCTLRPPCLLWCFPSHPQQISSDITSSPLSSSATKTQTSKGTAWRLNESACNSGNTSSLSRISIS